MLQIKGFAAPFGTRNSYHEVLDPATFNRWFADPAHRANVEMKSHHSAYAGYWSKVWTDDTGIWCVGTIVCPKTIAWAKTLPASKRQLSVEFQEHDGDPRGQVAEITPERAAEVLYSDHVPIKKVQVIYDDMLAAIDTGDDSFPIAEGATMHLVRDHLITTIAHFNEISLTDRGAYPGTHFEFI